MATLVGNETDLVDLLNNLIELDFDAIEAYEAAAARIENLADRAQLNQFCEDHRTHVAELNTLVREMQAVPATKADAKQILTTGKVVLGALLGDKAILLAMKTNEDDTNTAYERAAGRSDIPARIRLVLERGLGDERRHQDWIVQRISVDSTTARR